MKKVFMTLFLVSQLALGLTFKGKEVEVKSDRIPIFTYEGFEERINKLIQSCKGEVLKVSIVNPEGKDYFVITVLYAPIDNPEYITDENIRLLEFIGGLNNGI